MAVARRRARPASLSLLCALAASSARAGSSAPACVGVDDPLAAVADFEYGLGGWSAGNTSEWAWHVGCDESGPPCAAFGHGYMLAVGAAAPLLSPLLAGACVSASYFAVSGVDFALDALDEAGHVERIATLPASRGWRSTGSLALPPRLVRLRFVARAAAGERWLVGSAGLDRVVVQLLAEAAGAGGDAEEARDEEAGGEMPAGGWPLLPRASLSPVGVCVSTAFARRPVPLVRLAAAVRARGIEAAKLYQYDAALVGALVAGGVRELVIGIPNLELHNLALSPGHADRLVGSMAEHAALIAYVMIGNEPLASWWGGAFSDDLPRAVEHVQAALRRRGWQARATVALQADVLVDTWPPASASFDARNERLLTTVLPQLAAAGSALMVNLYPFLAWRAAAGRIGLDYCTFRAPSCVKAGRSSDAPCYANMLDAMVDAVTVALGKIGLRSLPLIVGEVGWPTGGQEPGADVHSACAFTNALLAHARFGRTPLGHPLPRLFLFELLDEAGKSASVATLGASERHFGLLTEGGAAKFELDWTPRDAQSGREAVRACPPPAPCSEDQECTAVPVAAIPVAAISGAAGATIGADTRAGAPAGSAVGEAVCFEEKSAFCVPALNAADTQLSAALSWLCAPASAIEKRLARAAGGAASGAAGGGASGGGGVNCAPLSGAGERCASAPLRTQAFWAATMYARERGASACDFDGAFAWSTDAPPQLLDGRCPLGVCEASVPDELPQGRARAGGACLAAKDCDGTFSPARSVLVGPVCDRLPFASAASGSCKPVAAADPEELTRAMDWACSVGGVNCTALRTLCAGAPLRERATWVFTAYASARDKNGGAHGASSCSFEGIAELSAESLPDAAPKCDIGTCHMPSQTLWQSPLFVALLATLALGYALMRLRASARLEREWAEALELGGLPEPPAGASISEAAGAHPLAAAAGAQAAAGLAEPRPPAVATWRGKSEEMQML